MATGYFTQVFNTTIQGSNLVSNLSGVDVRQLEFAAATTDVTKHTTAASLATQSDISAGAWVQAAIDTLGINPVANTITYMSLGPDAASQASAYLQLFNISDTTMTRVLRMHQLGTLSNTANAGVITLANSSGSSTFVQVNLSSGTAGSSTGLFRGDIAVGGGNVSGTGVGLQRIIVVSSNNVSPGSENVVFNILGASL